MTMPRYQLLILLAEQQRIEALRLNAAMTATSAPHLKDAARRDLVRRVDRATRLPSSAPPPMTSERTGERDPDAAAAWFAARGIRVQRAEAS